MHFHEKWFLASRQRFYGFNVLMSFLMQKMIPNDLEISSENKFWTQNMQKIYKEIVIRSCPDLPRPVQEDKYLPQASGNTFFQKLHLSILY